MAETENEQLFVLVEARIKDLERNMAKASATTGREFGKMRRSSKSATAAMERDMARSTARINQALASVSGRIGALSSATGTAAFAGLKTGALATLAPILGVSAAIGKAKEAMSDFDKIAKTAKAAGLDGEFYQEFAFGAGLAGVSVGELDSALLLFIKNSAQAANNQGELYSKLKASNPELLKAIQNAGSQQERLRLLADAIDKAKSSTEKANIATAAFGRNGAKMVNVFDGGSAAMDRTAARARELGLVVDNDLLARAEDLNDEFSIASQVLDLQFKQVLINLMPYITDTATAAGELAKAINSITTAIGNLPSTDISGWIRSKAAALGIPDLSQTAFAKAIGAKSLGEARIGAQFSATSGSGSGNDAQDEAIRRALGVESGETTALPAVTVTAPRSASATPASRARSAVGRGEAALNDYQREIESIKERTAALQTETAAQAQLDPLADDYATALEKVRTKQELLNAAHQAGIEITPDVAANIEKLADAYATASTAADKLDESQQKAQQSAEEMAGFEKDTLKGFITDLENGSSAGEAFANALQKIADKMLDSALDSLFASSGSSAASGASGTGLTSTIGTLLSSFLGFDSGGYTGSGGKHQPAGIVHKGEYVIDADTTKRIGVGNLDALRGYASGGFVGEPVRAASASSGGSGSSSKESQKAQKVDLNVNVAGANGDKQIEAMVKQGVQAGLAQYDGHLGKTIGHKLANYQSRN
ncbi:hypothetical protein [Consotaella aegiceratis]|uniref:hypothetical protein n=1 Tax=Consotaella aegiceratis TaxID=3097961 RepID=UPI002F3E7B90